MKRTKWVFFIFASLIFSAVAFSSDFTPPPRAFSGTEIAEALAKAKEEQRAILVMYYDYRQGQASWKRRSMNVLNAMDPLCVVVYVDGTELRHLPAQTRSELSNERLGTVFPRAVMMNVDLSELLFPIPQKDWAYDFDRTMREAQRIATSYRLELRRNADQAAREAAQASIVDAPVERTWTDTQGRTLRATLNTINGDSISVTRSTGLRATIVIETLSEEDRAYLKTYAGSIFDRS